MPIITSMKHRWQQVFEPEQFGPQRSCKLCGLAERTDVGPMNRKVRIWQWLREDREFLDMPACPGDEPHKAEPYTLKIALGNARTRG